MTKRTTMHHRKTKTKRLNNIAISNSPVNTKKFTRKDLEDACRRTAPTRNDNSKRQRGQFEIELLATHKAAGAESQLKSLDTGVKMCARKYNDCKSKADRLEEQLQKKRDELIELGRECNVLDHMVQGNNEEAKKITKLKADVEESNAAAEEKKHYRFKLNHMHMRQRKNAINVDAHMSELLATLTSAKNERRKCQKMLGEIESGVKSSLHEYEETKKEIELERSHRENELATKHMEKQNAQKMEEWRNSQESNRQDFQQALVGSTQIEKENKMKRIRELQNELKIVNKTSNRNLIGKDSTDEAFTHIKKATGVNCLEELVEKFISRQDQTNGLLNEKAEAEGRVAMAKRNFDSSLEVLNQLKSNGSTGGTEVTRDLLDNITDSIENERTEGKILKSTNSRLDTVLVCLRQGGMGLYQKLLPFHQTFLDGDAPLLIHQHTLHHDVMDSANDTLEMLKVVQQIVGKMLDAIGGIDEITKDQRDSLLMSNAPSISKLENPNLGDHNCRIRARGKTPYSPNRDYGEEEDGGADDDCENDFGTSMATRRTIKAQRIRDLGDAKKKTGESEQQRKRQSQQSTNTYRENSSKARNEDQGAQSQSPSHGQKQQGDGKSNNAGTGSSSAMDEAKKMQEESMARMAQHSVPFGLPKSVSLRDDPLTRASAFLTEMPLIE